MNLYIFPVKGSKFLDRDENIVSVLYLTEITLYLSNRLLLRRWYASFMKLRMFFIISGFNPFLVLKIFVASIYKFLSLNVTGLTFLVILQKILYDFYIQFETLFHGYIQRLFHLVEY